MYEYWHQKLIVEYTHLSLTQETYRPAAISALAGHFLGRLRVMGKEDRLVAGLWRTWLLEGLAWRCFGSTASRRNDIGIGMGIYIGMAAEVYLAPSWS